MPQPAPLHVLAISGSLRKGSFNTALLVAAQDAAPKGMTIELADLAPIPLYNDDVWKVGFPTAVAELRSRILAADALLIATPEYNASMPGVLKNAIDWVSRPPDQPFDGKPTAILGATPGRLATARAQAHLRQSLTSLNALLLNGPSLMVGGAGALIGDDGWLADEVARERIAGVLAALAQWTQRLASGE